MKHAVTIRNEAGEEAASIHCVKRVGDKLVMDGKALGTMQMDMILSAEDALRGIRMMFTWQVLSFIILLPFYAIRNKIIRRRKDNTKQNYPENTSYNPPSSPLKLRGE